MSRFAAVLENRAKETELGLIEERIKNDRQELRSSKAGICSGCMCMRAFDRLSSKSRFYVLLSITINHMKYNHCCQTTPICVR